jgi:hypothetical protein
MPNTFRLAPHSLPFLTLPDPPVTGEGALDPLGLATVGDRLADWMLPGLTARMSRPRFLTAIAVSTAVCEGLEDTIAADAVSPAYLVFEWLLVEGFVREADRADVRRTPGIDKVAACRRDDTPLCARAYLKAPTVFGFHGVYRRLARHLGILDDEGVLGENGYVLLKTWEREQGLEGFVESGSAASGNGGRRMLRDAVADSLKVGYSNRKGGWQGWRFFAEHLVPAQVGKHEAELLRRLLLDAKGDTRGEILQLVEGLASPEEIESESALADHLLPHASEDLSRRVRAVAAYEGLATLLETAFDWLRWLSSRARALSRAEYAAQPEVRQAVAALPSRLGEAEQALDQAPHQAQEEFSELARYFTGVSEAEALHEALHQRHAEVQKAKPPDGKRPWFEVATDGSTMVRVPYRLDQPPAAPTSWGRPYRLSAVVSFCLDLRKE